ncbi:MAG TPA: NAD kinase [Paenalcaligenes sp.]|nr:NAD kinase [Paenalcaligenes sp.]
MHFKTVALVGRYQDSGLEKHLHSLAEMLQSAGCTVVIEEETARFITFPGYQQCNYAQMGSLIDLAIIVGGDGTMLGAARALAHFNVPLIGINLGRLGFITDIPLQEASEALKNVLAGHYVKEERTMLEGRVVREGKTLFSSIALNDIVINRAGRSGMIELRVELNDVFMHRQRADGMIISTPTGSTAYALAANGPILDPRLRALLLVPVAPQTLSNRPVVVPEDSQLTLTITSLGRGPKGASVNFDMQAWSDCQIGDRVDIRRADNTVCFVHPTGYDFFSTLRQKLGWNRMLTPADYDE